MIRVRLCLRLKKPVEKAGAVEYRQKDEGALEVEGVRRGKWSA